jgi:hypothetical protein
MDDTVICLKFIYDNDKEEITEIKPLVMHQSANGDFLFQLLERRNAVTFRKRPTTPTADAAPSQGVKNETI